MIRATQVLGQHRWTHAAADTVVLDFDDRHRRRMAMTGTRGLEFLLDLENAVALRGGDALVLEDGRLVGVGGGWGPAGWWGGSPPPSRCSRSAATIRTTLFASAGISAIAICRRRSWPRACASAATTSSKPW